MCPKTDGILESSLYVSDVARSVRFYEETFGFRVISEFGERGCAMHAGTRQVLLLFKKGTSRATQSPHVRLCDRVFAELLSHDCITMSAPRPE
jgi:catechol 2,3-dioxygenase-like lactoylglutathione lyase family enzyme